MAADLPAVAIEDLVVAYGPKVAVDGVTITASPGEVVALLGRNGAGKTSTVETAEGYRRPASGRLQVLGLDPTVPSDHRQLTRRIGVMLQKGGVYPGMGAREAITLFASYYEDPEPPAALIDRLDLAEVATSPWRRLSGGEQQRVSLALALVGRPEVVFLDEPTAGVDPRGRLAIRGEIASLRDRGACVLLTTHELEEAERVADRIVIIDHGKVVATGTVAELTAGAGQLRFRASPGLDIGSLGRALGAEVVESSAGDYAVGGKPTPAIVATLTTWLAERDLTLGELRTGSSLEEVFLSLTDDGATDEGEER